MEFHFFTFFIFQNDGQSSNTGLKIPVVVRMIKSDDLADLDAYDRGRIDANELFIQTLEKGNRQTKTKEELMAFLIREMNPVENEMEGRENESI